MKQTKQVRKMVETVNQYLRDNHIKDDGNPVFATMEWLLLQADCYHGFNYFTAEGQHSGGINEKFDHLELYIS